VVVDALGIHFDPSGPSDLEAFLNGAQMSPKLLRRAQSLREIIVRAGISKYSADSTHVVPERTPGKRLVLVPGQVEDDMSVRAGGGGLSSNLELLRRARLLEPDAKIWFRPHPDVDAGHRRGKVPDADILVYADHIVRGGGMAPLLDIVDAVHVLTSLTGFEALMRGCEVTCHGTPFYAGWGLTRDLGEPTGRRTTTLSLDALVAGVLILYPRYLDPVTGLPCPPEVLISRMASATATNRLKWIVPLRRWQGKLMKMIR
jgi:capsular polysaccharide export protein